jgi:site-specific recombinase XerD/ribosomal protein L40E
MSHDIYESPKRLEYVLKKIREDSKIINSNKESLFKFHQFCIVEGLSLSRVIRCLYAIRSFAEWTKKDFNECKKDDIFNLIAELEKSKYMHSTKQEMRITLKKFFKWLKNTEDYPEEVRWIKCRRTLNNNKLPEDLLTEDDVKLLINSADKKRDKALIAVLYESGCRIGELLSLRMKHISFENHGAHLLVDGKTGMRRVMIIASVPYLQDWIDEHPKKDNPDAPLWILEKKVKELNHKDVQRILRKIKERSGIKKKTNAHNFRHSRATFLASHLTDAVMKEMFGWVQSSKMASVYIHMSGKNVDNALLKLYGIQSGEEEKDESKFLSKKCERCGEENPPTNKFCRVCGMTLDKKDITEIIEKDMERRKADEILDKLIQNPEFKEMFLNKIKEII